MRIDLLATFGPCVERAPTILAISFYPRLRRLRLAPPSLRDVRDPTVARQFALVFASPPPPPPPPSTFQDCGPRWPTVPADPAS